MTGSIEKLGRRLLMDFGFGAFLEKFEEHFGKRASKGLVLLIGLCVALFCGQMIWTIALGPAVSLATQAMSRGNVWQILINVAWTAIFAAFGLGLGSFITASFARWHAVRRLKKTMFSAEETMNMAVNFHDVSKADWERMKLELSMMVDELERDLNEPVSWWNELKLRSKC